MSGNKCRIVTPFLPHVDSGIFDKIYEPAEDTFLMIDALEDDLNLINNLKPLLCLEVGCGSGLIISALAMSLGSSSFCIASDINETACKMTHHTSVHNGVPVDVIKTDLCSGLALKGAVDVLICNPPYVVTPPEELSSLGTDGVLARAWAGGKKGREVMDRLFPSVPQLLSQNGLFYLLIIAENCLTEIEDIMKTLGYSMSVIKERKIRGEHLMVLRFNRK